MVLRMMAQTLGWMHCAWIFTPFAVGAQWGGDRTLESAAVALSFEMPELAKSMLESKRLSPFPQANQVRILLSKAAFLKNDLTEMVRQQNLAVRGTSAVWARSFFNWMQWQQLDLVPVLQYTLNDFSFVEEKIWYLMLQAVAFYPVNSPKWSSQWAHVRRVLGEAKMQHLLVIALQMKARGFCYSQSESSWVFSAGGTQAYLSTLWMQKQWVKLKEVLGKLLQDTTADKSQRLMCYLCLLHVKDKLNEDATAVLLEALQKLQDYTTWVDTMLKTWVSSNSFTDALSKIKNLQELFRKRHWTRALYALKLIEIDYLLAQGSEDKAQRNLTRLFVKIPDNLKKYAYLLQAKLHFTSDAPNYRLIADDLNDAKRYESQHVERYTALQADLYFLDQDYNRAYYLYEELLYSNALPVDLEHVAYKWVTCGIFCEEGIQELQQQFDVCTDLSLLNAEHRAQLCLLFAQYLFDKQSYAEALKFLEDNVAYFLKINLFEQFNLIKGKCLLKMGELEQSLQSFSSIDEKSLDEETRIDLILSRSLALAKQGEDDLSEKGLQTAMSGTSAAMVASVLFDLSETWMQRGMYMRAQRVLLAFVQKFNTSELVPLALLQAATCCEQRGLLYARETLDILKTLLKQYPTHPLCFYAKLKEGTLLMNLNQMEAAEHIFRELKTETTELCMQAFCELCSVRCKIALPNPDCRHCAQQLESLLLPKNLPLALTLEITLQLAYIQLDEGFLNEAQQLLWNTCYPFLQLPHAKLNGKEIYWLTRCLLALAQHTKDKNVAVQVYTLMLDAGLLDESRARPYLMQLE